jgi:hypothetical protein
MRKVQHELQDMMEMDAAQHGSRPSDVSVWLKTPPTPLSPRPLGLTTAASAGSGNSLLSGMSVEPPTGASSLGSDSAVSGSAHSPGKMTVAHALLGRMSHASEHDLSSTDDEHDHLTASHESSSQSRDNSFTLNDAASSFSRPVSGISAGLEQSSLIEPLERIPSDPTIIDPSQDAVVNQISAELFEVAHRCAQQLKVRPHTVTPRRPAPLLTACFCFTPLHCNADAAGRGARGRGQAAARAPAALLRRLHQRTGSHSCCSCAPHCALRVRS